MSNETSVPNTARMEETVSSESPNHHSDQSDDSDETLVADPAPIKRYSPPVYPDRPRLFFLGGCLKKAWEEVINAGPGQLFNVVIHDPLEFLLFLAEYPDDDLLERMARVTFWIQPIPLYQHVPFRRGGIPYWPGDFRLMTDAWASPVPTLSELSKEWTVVQQRPEERIEELGRPQEE